MTRTRGRAAWLVGGAVLAAVALEAVALYDAQQTVSASYDEPELLYSGMRSWKLGDFSVSPHPPLTKLLGALPVWLAYDPRLPHDPADDAPPAAVRTGWAEAKTFVYDNAPFDATAMLRLGRLPTIGMWALMVLAAAGWSYQLYGWRAALLTTGLAMSCPIGLNSGQTLTTDIGGACFSVLAGWLVTRALHAPSRTRWALAGAAYGLALGSRYQALALFATGLGIAAVHALGRPHPTDRSAADAPGLAPQIGRGRAGFADVALAAAAALATLLAIYRGTSIAHYPSAIEHLRHSLGPGGAIPFFLDGETSTLGWLGYFPRALLFKLPPPHLLAIALALVGLVVRRPRRAEWLLIGPAGVLFALAMVSRINYGVRHVLPVLPVLYVLFGRLAAPGGLASGSRVAMGVLALVPLAGLVEQARAHPHYPPYISPLFGGPSQAYRLLADSNVDAGQGLVFLAQDQNAHPGGVLLAYHGTADPRYHGIPYRYLAGFFDEERLEREPAPRPGETFPPRWLAVSSTYLSLYGHAGSPGAFRFLADTPPERQPGYSILVWDLERHSEWLGPLAGVYLERSLSRRWDVPQQVELRQRATFLLRRSRTRAPGAVALALDWLRDRMARMSAETRVELSFLMAVSLAEAGFPTPARDLFTELSAGQWGRLDPHLEQLTRENLETLRRR